MFYRIIGGVLIQLSDNQLEGFEVVIEEDKPEYDEDTQYLAYSYVIEDGKVYKRYEVADFDFSEEENDEN